MFKDAIPVHEILKDAAAWSDEIVDEVSKELLKEMRTSSRTVFADKSGTLRKSIKRRKAKFGDGYIVGAFAPHAHLVEHGTDLRVSESGKVSGHMPALPFATPAAKVIQDRLPEIIERATKPISIKVKK